MLFNVYYLNFSKVYEITLKQVKAIPLMLVASKNGYKVFEIIQCRGRLRY